MNAYLPILIPWAAWTFCLYLLISGWRHLDGRDGRHVSTLLLAEVLAAVIVSVCELGGALIYPY